MHNNPSVSYSNVDYQQKSGADPFAPHVFEPKQRAMGDDSIPRILIEPEAYADMMAIAMQSGHNEISWLGSVDVLEDNRFLIGKIIFVKQEVHGSTTEMTEEGLGDAFTDLIIADPVLSAKIMFWGHVHPSNSTSPSPQDEKQMKDFNHNPWFIRGIFGRGGRAEFTFFDYKKGVIWNDVPWQIYVPVSEVRNAFWKTEIDAKVTQKAYVVKHVAPPMTQFYNGNQIIVIDDSDDADQPSAIQRNIRRKFAVGEEVRPRRRRLSAAAAIAAQNFESSGEVIDGLPPFESSYLPEFEDEEEERQLLELQFNGGFQSD